MKTLELRPVMVCNLTCDFCGMRKLEDHATIGGFLEARGIDATQAVWPGTDPEVMGDMRRFLAHPHIPRERLFRVLGEARDLGFQRILVSGMGEPLLRWRDTLDAIAFARRELGLEVSLITNGTIGAERASELVATGVNSIAVSLDSPHEAVHDRLRGRPGLWARTTSFLRALDEARRTLGSETPELDIYTVVTEWDAAWLCALLDVASSLGVAHLNLKEVDYGPGRDTPAMPTLSEAGRERVLTHASRLGVTHNLDDALGRTRRADGHCQRPWDSLVVHATGLVTPCCLMSAATGLFVQDLSLAKVWTSPFLSRLRDQLAVDVMPPECARCSGVARVLTRPRETEQ